MHFRKDFVKCSNYISKHGNNNAQTINEYKYFGILFNEYIDIGKMALILDNSRNRALGAIINKFTYT